MYDNRKVAGALLFIAGVQCVMGIIIAEALYPGYSTSENYISDLGVGPSAVVFNSSVFLLGVIAVVGAYFIHRSLGSRLLSVCIALTGIGVMGVGVFSENFGILHFISSLVTFLFGGLSVTISYRTQKPAFSNYSILLGALSLAALVLFGSGTYLGLGKGGMERMIAYPSLLWAVGFGGYLMSCSGEKAARS
jgi:hypothetical membrane protein